MNSYDNKIIQDDMKLLLKRQIEYEKLNNKTLLITGGTGLLASYIVYFLIFLNENIKFFNCKIILLLRNKQKAIERFGKYIEKDCIKCYYDDINKELKINEKVDYIVHAASIADTKYFSVSPVEVIKPNVLGTYNLLELAKKNNINSFLFFSSCSVYGKVENNDSITEKDFGILDPLNINSCYSESKRCGENICKSYWIQNNIPIKIARISHTYGPTIDLNTDSRVFSEFIKNVLEQKNIELKSNGNAVRSFCYIVDAVDAFFKILINGQNGEVYNISNKEANISIKDLAKLLSKIYNIDISYTKRDDKYVENEYSNIISFDTKKLEKLNWKNQINIEDGFKRTIESFEVE